MFDSFSPSVTDGPQSELVVLHVDSETVSLGVEPIDSSYRSKLHIQTSSNTQIDRVIKEESSSVAVEGLTPGTEYTFSITRVSDNGAESKSDTVSVFTGKFVLT